MTIEIQPLEQEDEKAVVRVFKQEKAIWPWGGKVIFWRFFNHRGRTEQWAKAVVDGAAVGFVHWAMRADNVRTIYDIVVDKEFRGQGIGRKLLEAVGRPILLKTDSTAPSNGFYTKVGFKKQETLLKDGKKPKTVYYLPREFQPMSDIEARIITYTGKHINLLKMRPEDICIEDIAHALACVNRFAGHAVKPVSVAQHSVYVSKLCDPEQALQGLLHDASEAYIGDVTKWLKATPEFLGYRKIEQRIQKMIFERFGCDTKMHPSVAEADRLMVCYEAPKSFGAAWTWNGMPSVYTPVDVLDEQRIGKWAPWPWRTAEENFLVRYRACLRGVEQ